MREELIKQLTILVSKLTDKPEILSVIGSISDTLPDEEVIKMLKHINLGIDPLTKLPY